MTLEQIETRARALLATLPPESETADLLSSTIETLEGLTGPQRRSARILQQMGAFLEKLEAGLAKP